MEEFLRSVLHLVMRVERKNKTSLPYWHADELFVFDMNLEIMVVNKFEKIDKAIVQVVNSNHNVTETNNSRGEAQNVWERK